MHTTTLEQIIVSKSEFDALKRSAFIGKVGWGVVTVVALVLGYVGSLLHARIEVQDQLATQTIKLETALAHITEISENQKAQQDVLISWGEYVKERSILSVGNLNTTAPYVHK